MSHRATLAAAVAIAGLSCACERGSSRGGAYHGSSTPPTIAAHAIRVDSSRKLLSWSREDSPYAHVSRLAWTAFETKFSPVAREDGGALETWLSSSRFDPETFEGLSWPHNPAGLYAMLVDSALRWYAFSGDDDAVTVARRAVDYQLDHGTTPADWDWARVPYASANGGDADYAGADDEWCDFCGRGDGPGVIEPDKVGELGFAYARMFEKTDDTRYRDAAIACADALARHVREGEQTRSPWPFRVYARTGVAREEYSSNVLGAVELFDELRRLGAGDDGAYARARTTVVEWLLRVPIRNDAWSGYFEDIDIQTDPTANPNQYSALRTAQWLMAHPEEDPAWRDHAAHLMRWAGDTFGVDTAAERGTQWGATVMSEQTADMAKMGSHTARFGATLALWSAAAGDAAARETAYRSLNWATYTCGDDGIVAVGEDKDEGWWFSDGYGDYVRHFLVAMGAAPEWAPAREAHIVASTSLVTHVEYSPASARWTTFDSDSVETLRLPALPSRVTGGDYDVEPIAPGAIVTVRHHGAGEVEVAWDAPSESAAATGVEEASASGCSTSRTRSAGAWWWLLAGLACAKAARARRAYCPPKSKRGRFEIERFRIFRRRSTVAAIRTDRSAQRLVRDHSLTIGRET